MQKIVRPKELALYLSVSISTLWRIQKADDFPKKIQLGPKAVGWDSISIDSWIESKSISKTDNVNRSSI